MDTNALRPHGIVDEKIIEVAGVKVLQVTNAQVVQYSSVQVAGMIKQLEAQITQLQGKLDVLKNHVKAME